MLRSRGLTEKVIVLGIDGMDPRFSRALVNEGKMPNLKKLIEKGAAREDLMLLGAMPTITPPMWTTLATGCYPMTHGVQDFCIQVPGELDVIQEAMYSTFCKAEQIWNVTAEAGKKTLVWHWPGSAWPPSSDSPNLMVVDGTSPGTVGHVSAMREMESLIIASTKVTRGGISPYMSQTSHINCDIDEVENTIRPGISLQHDWTDEYFKEVYLKDLVFQGYTPPKYMSIRSKLIIGDTPMWNMANFPLNVSMSPITEPEGWANAPEGAKEFAIYYSRGRVIRPALILQHNGKYDQVAIYSSKDSIEPITVLDNDVYTPNCYDTLPRGNTTCTVVRNMRALEIAEDGTYVRMWVSDAHDIAVNDCWYPRWIFEKITSRFGPPPATSMAAGQDPDLMIKCGHEQWIQAAKWQADSLKYMMDEEGVEVIFSHFHGPDLAGHCYMKYLKNREDSLYDEKEVRKWHESTYTWTDNYIGEFLPYIDKGWTIILMSDHSLVCAEEIPNVIGDNGGVNVDVMEELGYTVLKTDENGNKIAQIDWEKTKAIQSRVNSIYVNLKGRDRHGIVDPEDKYELEEQIITDLYGYKDKRTGKRIVALALHNKDAVLLGLGGPDAADIIFMIHEDYSMDHGENLSTAYGHNDTTVSPIFVAAGPGVKENHTIKGWVREVDIAPTVSVLLGVDFPRDCEGAPAYQIFTERV